MVNIQSTETTQNSELRIGMSVSVVIQKACSTVGEGPHWDMKNGSLLYVDIKSGNIYKWNPTTNDTSKVHLEGNVGFVTPRASGGLVTGLNQSLVAVDWDGNNLTTLAEVDKGTPNRINDGKCDSTGRLWAGTMVPLDSPDELQLGTASLYSFEKDGATKSHVQKISLSNGIAWSSDNATMYFVDSIPRQIYALDFDLNNGIVSNQRTAIDLSGTPRGETGLPDGMCADINGKLWVALCGAGKVAQFDPETGSIIHTIEFQTDRITSCCFGGPNLDELYVTSMNYGINPRDIIKDDPLAGSIFKVTGLGVKGTPMYEFEG